MSVKYPGEGHPWADYLHHRARAIDWLFSGEGQASCKDDDAAVAKVLSMEPQQVMLIRMRDRSIANA